MLLSCCLFPFSFSVSFLPLPSPCMWKRQDDPSRSPYQVFSPFSFSGRLFESYPAWFFSDCVYPQRSGLFLPPPPDPGPSDHIPASCFFSVPACRAFLLFCLQFCSPPPWEKRAAGKHPGDTPIPSSLPLHQIPLLIDSNFGARSSHLSCFLILLNIVLRAVCVGS